MPDWTRVNAGIFHAFHHRWILAISDLLNERILPPDCYALPERSDALEGSREGDAATSIGPPLVSGTPAALARPAFEATAQTDMEFYSRKQNALVVRHVSGDRVVAMIEIVSPGNKSTRHAFASFVEKAAQLLQNGVHLLLIDPFPPGRRDPHGLHAAIWEEIAGEGYSSHADNPLTLAAYEAGLSVRAFVRGIAAGDPLPDLPLFLELDACVTVPLESTYVTAFAAQPQRWRRVLESRD